MILIKLIVVIFIFPYRTNAQLKFSKETYSFEITENAPIGTFVGQVLTDSNTTADYRIVPLSFLMTHESDFPVVIDKSGSLYTKSHIDREKYLIDNQASISFNIEASTNSIYSYCRVNLNIQDLNDNAPTINFKLIPQFAKVNNSDIFIHENTSVNQIIAYVGITDNDFLENGTISSIQLKSLNKSCPVRLNKISDKLFTIQLINKLIYAQKSVYDLELRVKDNGSTFQLETTSYLKINVLETNKHRPFFSSNLSKIELTENVISNRSLYNFTAIDYDLTGNLTFELENFKDIFYLRKNQLWQKMSINQSFLSTDRISVSVMAYDEIAGVRLSSTFELHVFILDLNDNRPVIQTKASKFKYYLNRKKDRFVKIVPFIFVSDLDSLATNSINFEQNKFAETKILIQNRLNEKNLFKFLDMECREAFSFKLNTNVSLPFVFLVENVPSLFNVKCRLSIWLDTAKFNVKIKKFNFDLFISDNGVILNYTRQNFNIKILHGFQPKLKINQTVYFGINKSNIFVSNSSNGSFYYENFGIDQDGYMVMDNGYLANNSSLQLIQNYSNMLNDLFGSGKVKYKESLETKISFMQLKKILFNSNSSLSDGHGKVVFYICISSGLVMFMCFLLALFIKNDKSTKKLNVVDDKIVKCTNLDYDKPDNCSNSSSDEQFPSPYSSLELKTNYSKLFMVQKSQMLNYQFSIKMPNGSGSSNYAESDEGCYGSSDFSSEKDLESKQQHLCDTNQYLLNQFINVNNSNKKITESYV